MINNGIQIMRCDVYNHMLVFTLLFYPQIKLISMFYVNYMVTY